jgi:hypothetical protein
MVVPGAALEIPAWVDTVLGTIVAAGILAIWRELRRIREQTFKNSRALRGEEGYDGLIHRVDTLEEHIKELQLKLWNKAKGPRDD